MKVLIYKNKKGNIVVVHAIGKVAEVKAKAEKLNPGLTFIKEDESENLPNREFRDQWDIIGDKVGVDPVKETKERWNRVRKERNDLLKETDIEMLQGVEKGEDKTALKKYRQDLRDITKQPNPKLVVWPTKP